MDDALVEKVETRLRSLLGGWFTPSTASTWTDLVRAAIQAVQEAQWRPISEAKKDGTIIWAKLRDDIYPVLRPTREDLECWNGVHVPLRHYGLAADGFDIGWGIAARVGCGGFPDEWIARWMPLPSFPKEGDNG